MLIRHKIILWFIGLTGLLLCLFSIYIYLAFANSRKQVFQERIRNKAIATREIYDQHNRIAEKIITSIPEQSEYVFDENYHTVFAINDLHDFDFDKPFLESVTKGKELYFEYTKSGGQKKEGFAFCFGSPKQAKIIVITAFDKAGRDQVKNLGLILIVGNLFFLVLIGLSGYWFARSVLRPLIELVNQVESVQADNLGYRLDYRNTNDEIGIVTISFNRVLDRIQTLVDAQKAFISYASHELRTPLAAISGILETSTNYDHNLNDAKKSIEAARQESQRATGLINGLLQLAKIESVSAVEMKTLNIVDLLIDTISSFKLKNPSQEFSLNIAQKLPNNIYVELIGNDHLLRTAFFNVIDNASKYSARQKIEISLIVVPETGILIRVTDTGVGIEEEDMIKIMSPLFRGRNTTGIDGFGIGLALTNRIISLHKGEIAIKRNPGSGITVEMFLTAHVSENV